MNVPKLTIKDFQIGTICAVNMFDKEEDGIPKFDIQIELEPLDEDLIGDDQIFASWWVEGTNYSSPSYVEAFSREGRNDTENILFQDTHLKEMLQIIENHIKENGLRAY